MRRTPYLATIAVLALAACTDHPSPVAPQASRILTETELAQAVAAGDVVSTPNGWYYRECVHEVPNFAHVDRKGVVRLTDGSTYQKPKCSRPGRVAIAGRKRAGKEDLLPPTNDGWMESAYVTGTPIGELVATWKVPAAPVGTYSSPETYYAFPGIESAEYIIQPVLSYGYAPGYGGNAYRGASWRCDDGDDCLHGSVITLSPGDSVLGTVTASACANEICTWTIVTVNVTTGSRSEYAIEDTAAFTTGVGGAVEVNVLNSCNRYPYPKIEFKGIQLRDQNNQSISPSWNTNVPSNPNPACSFGVSTTSSTVSLTHYTPLSASINLGPSSVKANQSNCSWSVAASGGGSDYSFAWTKNWNPVGGDSPTLDLSSTGTSSFTLRVTVTDGFSNQVMPSKSVTVSAGAQNCGPL